MMPKKATPFDAAYDVYVPKDLEVREGRQVIDLGFSLEMPHGMGAFIRARSGFMAKGVDAMMEYWDGAKVPVRLDAFTPTGLIDSGYRGTLGVVLVVNHLDGFQKRVFISKGTRIAQLQFVAVPSTDLVEAEELDMTDDRGGGFGHTNKKML